VLFVGSDNAFNLEGVTWFLASVWPSVLRRVPAARLDLCGAIARGLPRPLPAGVDDHGGVPDLTPFYREAAVVVVPLLRATGLNIKLVEAAGLGRAIVATGTTLEGAPFLRDAVEAAETAEAFADSVARLLLDPAARDALAARARAVVAGTLSPETCYGPLAAALGPRP
jgi:succinoglycan biosynthesis protein ExoO